MGWAKFDEDIRDENDERWGEADRNGILYYQTCCGSSYSVLYLNEPPNVGIGLLKEP